MSRNIPNNFELIRPMTARATTTAEQTPVINVNMAKILKILMT